MPTGKKSIISMTQSRHFREQNGLPVKKVKLKKPNFDLAKQILRWEFPGDEKPYKKPPS
jgi:hypothetical protein